MAPIRRYLKALKILLLERLYTNKHYINNKRAIFTFTFDDVPISAFTNGAKILEGHNLNGVYYVALDMEKLGPKSGERRFINAEEIKSLHKQGHDIGCHTYSHLNLRKHSASKIISDCNNNTNKLRNMLNIESIDHFAYPYGMVSLSGKRALGSKYKTLRTTEHGFNVGKTDLTHLKAVSLCSNTFNKDSIRDVIRQAISRRAWVIFYSHDICENPTEWGTNIEDFRWVVEQCVAADAEVLNVSDAYRKIIN